MYFSCITKDSGLTLSIWSIKKMTVGTPFTKRSWMSPTSLNIERESRRRLGRAHSDLPILRLSIGRAFSKNSLGELLGSLSNYYPRRDLVFFPLGSLPFYRLSFVGPISAAHVLMPTSRVEGTPTRDSASIAFQHRQALSSL